MIRNVVLVKLKAGQDPAVVAKAQRAFLDLNNQARAGLIRLTEQIARVQFEMP